MSAPEHPRVIDVLIVEDEDTQRNLLAALLEQHGLEVIGVGDVEAARKALAGTPVRVVLTDYNLPDGNGLDVLRAARACDNEMAVCLVTAYGTVQMAVEAMRAGAVDVLLKPVDPAQLIEVVQRALRVRGLETENRRLRARLGAVAAPEAFVAESAAMKDILAIVERLAPTRASVLVTGESGVGKEWIAKLLHAWGQDPAAPFVPTHCAALSPGLIDAELFGHARGAFTGAHAERPGVFEAADGGTLFLDEVGEFPPDVQVRLLRVLQEREVVRVGESKPRKVDVRLVAATNRDLAAAVAEGTFRQDLLYRLDVVRIEVPPLRERPADVAPLVATFSRLLAEREGLPALPFTPAALAALESQPWPGNVRELRNVVERSLLLAPGDAVDVADLPFAAAAPDAARTGGLEGAVTGLEVRMITEALQQTGGVQTRAAALLGIPERVLRYKMKKHGIARGGP